MKQKFEDHFSDIAKQYSQARPVYPRALFDWLASNIETRTLAWDCACGNGQASTMLASYFKTVLATDASAEQIAQASPAPNVRYQVARAEQSPLDPLSADLVTVAQAAHWFEHDAFHREVRRVTKPGGIFAVWGYDMLHVGAREVDALVQEFHERDIVPFWLPQRDYLKEAYRTLPFPFADEFAVPAFRIDMDWNMFELCAMFRTWSATKRFVETRGFDPVARFEPQLHAAWGDPMHRLRITIPIAMRAARV